ncbi:putative oxidoreductase (plasmid) [Rhodovulum sp. P5]|uniref:Gfo/Idh/MocA family protein n=1 Tax=Rhodovulum sp. P5 TaxID=1564506 RepID=UPI0009C34684|nr:Gfo/Idh/MocA family oxidoreductase [Rhodovulum sp. P5]ARE42553.1 putative oxidoreductase [Rhodovulum sp. P5]
MTELPRRPVRWAILGTGAVSRKFAWDLRRAGGILAAVASRDPENARRFAHDLDVAVAAPDYAAAVAADVDAVYVATPPALHEAHALLAIAAGKPVLVEKPFALDAAAAARIAAAARAAGVFCMEAMWTRFQPLPTLVQQRIADGALGELRGFEARFCGANLPEAGGGIFDADAGGGALMHRGIYPLSLARWFLGPVAEVQTMARIGASGVDEDSVLLLRHEGGALSTLRASLRSAGDEGITVYGTRATLQVEGPVWRPTGAVLRPTWAGPARPGKPPRLEALRESGAWIAVSERLSGVKRLIRGRGERLHAPFAGNGYRHEAQALMAALAEGRTEEPRMTLAQSVEIMELVDAARIAWGRGEDA